MHRKHFGNCGEIKDILNTTGHSGSYRYATYYWRSTCFPFFFLATIHSWLISRSWRVCYFFAKLSRFNFNSVYLELQNWYLMATCLSQRSYFLGTFFNFFVSLNPTNLIRLTEKHAVAMIRYDDLCVNLPFKDFINR